MNDPNDSMNGDTCTGSGHSNCLPSGNSWLDKEGKVKDKFRKLKPSFPCSAPEPPSDPLGFAVRDPVCPKCGSESIHKQWHEGAKDCRKNFASWDRGFMWSFEHLHIFCNVCGFEWCRDSLDAPKENFELCMAPHPLGFICTLRKNHDGFHVANDGSLEQRWFTEKKEELI